MEVTVYGPLRGATGEKHVEIAFDGGTLADALDAFVSTYPRAKRHLYTDSGDLAPSARLVVDGEAMELDDSFPPDATLQIHPAMRGG